MPTVAIPHRQVIVPGVTQDGSTSKIRTAGGKAAVVNSAVTYAMIVRTTGRDGAWRALMAALTSAGATTAGYVTELSSANQMILGENGFSSGHSTFTVTVADGRVLLVAAKDDGTVDIDYYKYAYDANVFTAEPNGNGAALANATAGGIMELGGDFGGSTDWFVGDFFLGAVFNRKLSQSEVEQLPFASIPQWLSTNGIVGLWTPQAGVPCEDLTGNGAFEVSRVAITPAPIHLSFPITRYNGKTLLISSIVSAVSKTLSASYTVKQTVTKTNAASYTVKQAITKTVAPAYTVKQAVIKTNTATYNVIQRIAKTLSASYAIQAVPVNTVAPLITGQPLSGQILTADHGTWTNSPTSYTYQWQVEDSPGAGTYSDISGETASTLQL